MHLLVRLLVRTALCCASLAVCMMLWCGVVVVSYVSSCAVLCCAVLCCVVLCSAVLYCRDENSLTTPEKWDSLTRRWKDGFMSEVLLKVRLVCLFPALEAARQRSPPEFTVHCCCIRIFADAH